MPKPRSKIKAFQSDWTLRYGLEVSTSNPSTSEVTSVLCLFCHQFGFSDSRIVLLLSWYIVVVGTGIPCAARKCLVHNIFPTASSIATSSASVELLVFNFCLLEAVYVQPLHSDMITPV